MQAGGRNRQSLGKAVPERRLLNSPSCPVYALETSNPWPPVGTPQLELVQAPVDLASGSAHLTNCVCPAEKKSAWDLPHLGAAGREMRQRGGSKLEATAWI